MIDWEVGLSHTHTTHIHSHTHSHTHTHTQIVKSWAGGESVLECGTLTEGRRNDNRDSWDEELDAGKVQTVDTLTYSLTVTFLCLFII